MAKTVHHAEETANERKQNDGYLHFTGGIKRSVPTKLTSPAVTRMMRCYRNKEAGNLPFGPILRQESSMMYYYPIGKGRQEFRIKR